MGHPSLQAVAHALVNQSAFWNEARSGYRVIFLRLSEKHQNMHKSILVAREENYVWLIISSERK